MTSYSDSVLIGNWNEEKLKKEYDFKIFLRRRDRGELLLQKARTLFSQSINGVMKPGCMPKYGLALSGLVTEKQVDSMQTLMEGCAMTLSPIMTPCCRNTFTIVSCTIEDKHGQKLSYGEEFALRTTNYDRSQPLYVKYVREYFPTPANSMPLQLSAHMDAYCRWKAVPLMFKDRLEGDGSPVKQGERLIIKNCMNDKNLCVMYQNWMQTFFGPECGVTLRNCLDVHKRTTAENIFKFVSDIETKKK